MVVAATAPSSSAVPPSGRPLRWWRHLIAPHARIQVPGERRRVRLAASLLLLLLLISVAMAVLYNPPGGYGPSKVFLTLATTALLGVAYATVRGPRPTTGVWMSVLVPWLALAVAWDQEALATSDSAFLYWGTIPLLLAGLVLPLRSASVFAAFHVASMATLLFAPNGEPYDAAQVRDAMAYALIIVALTLLASGFLDRSIRDQEATNQRLKETERYRLELLNVIAHDLASPLTPIQLQIDLLGRENGSSKRVDIIKRNADHLSRLVRDVKDLAKLEHGRLAILPTRVDLDTLVRRAADAFEGSAAEAGVRLAVTTEPLPALLDVDRVNQVLYNLITNALKFTPTGGDVRITASAQDGKACVAVTDTGRGLSAEELPRLFKPFSQVHDRAEVKEKGTGLGLYISKGIVEAHGGSIIVTSIGHGHGSTFTFQVPLAAAVAAPRLPANVSPVAPLAS